MEILGWTIARTKALAQQLYPPSSLRGTGGGWVPVVREPFTGAWQSNVVVSAESALAAPPVFTCITMIAGDIAKLALRLMALDADGIWQETTNPAFSPVLRKPNRYQTITKFIEVWMLSKLGHGNTYVLKERDQRGVVVALYVLDPARVTPLVSVSGDVYYQLAPDDLSGLRTDVIVPASEIIHDLMIPLFHPLVGVTPIFACGLAALQGLAIQEGATKFFQNGATPAGIITVPGEITDEQAARLKTAWLTSRTGDNRGSIAMLTNGMKYEAITMTATDAQLIDQLKWTAETVCSCFHVPPYLIGIGQAPPYTSPDTLLQLYYSTCLQTHLTNLEQSLDDGLGLTQKINGTQYGTEFDIDDLIWMDTATRTKAASDSIGGAAMSPDEARRRYLGLGPIPGGDSVYMQQQNYSLEALAARDLSQPPPPSPPIAPADLPAKAAARLRQMLRRAA